MKKRKYNAPGRPTKGEEEKLSERVQSRITVADREAFASVRGDKDETWMIRKVIKAWNEAHTQLTTGNKLIDMSRQATAGEMIRSADFAKVDLSVAVSIIRTLFDCGALDGDKLLDWMYDEDHNLLRSNDEIASFRYEKEIETFGEW